MYTALLECVTTPGLDGMRFALFLFKFAVFKTFTDSRFSERRLDRGAISFFASRPGRENLNSAAVAGLRMWESRWRFPSLVFFQASIAGRLDGIAR